MFSIVNNTILTPESEMEVTAAIHETSGNLHVKWDIPRHQKITFSLSSGTKKNLIKNQMYQQGESLEIPLKEFNADSFLLQVFDENRNAISQIRIMRSYC